MKSVQDRHDISDKVFQLLEPLLPGRRGVWGGIAKNNRQFINGVFWVFRTGAPWRDLPERYGGWSNTHRRFIRWRNKGVWEKILEKLADKPDYEWLMIDASHIKVHPHAAGAVKGNQKMSRTKGGSTQNYIWPWIRMVCRSERLLRQAQQQIVLKLNIWYKEFRRSIYLQIGVMIATLFFKKPLKLICCRLSLQRKTENIREITTKIYTKCAIELKMLSCILNGGVESPHVIVKIQTLF